MSTPLDDARRAILLEAFWMPSVQTMAFANGNGATSDEAKSHQWCIAILHGRFVS
jgi:hypothetical protein